MSVVPVSVVVVSRGRAADLPLCLTGLSQLDHPNFEMVLVADRDGLTAAKALPFFDQIKTVHFEQANISEARNLGIAQAAGEIVAFIDDDAVPEPTWLTHLCDAFADADVGCAGGFVLGRNGISFQWKARTVDRCGLAYDLAVSEEQITVLTPQPDRAIKTEGTNMAIRRELIAEIGGFDPAYRFFLDETDVNVRLAQLGVKTAIVPNAVVHHGYKASAQRSGERAPRDLYEIGASLVVFLRKHANPAVHKAMVATVRADQRNRALGHMVRGSLEPRDVFRLLHRFDVGVADGYERVHSTLPTLARASEGFRRFEGRFGKRHEYFAGRVWSRASVTRAAVRSVKGGVRASVFIFSPTIRAHRVSFTRDGYWLQTGGLFGRSDRAQRRISLVSFSRRLASELRRVQNVRGKMH